MDERRVDQGLDPAQSVVVAAGMLRCSPGVDTVKP
jgi:hypothetical protein